MLNNSRLYRYASANRWPRHPFTERMGIDSFQIREFVFKNPKIEKSVHEIILQFFEFPVGIFLPASN
jgi:hypothetical protein